MMTAAEMSAPTIPAPPPGPIVKECLCGATYTQEEWDELRYVGDMSDSEGGVLELRDCRPPCPSTLAIRVSR